MLTRRHRVQVTKDPGLTSALRIPELAIVEAQSLASTPRSEPERRALLESLAETFDDPAAAGLDWEVLRDSKQFAWIWLAPHGTLP